MSSFSPLVDLTSSSVTALEQRPRRLVLLTLLTLAMAYAFLAGLRTVSDTDTGWHLAGGRYMWQTKTISSVDVMSYTAEGKPWIYPVASQVLLFLLVQAGGFAALSLLNATACATTVAILLRAGGALTALLAMLAVPSIAHRTVPRGDLFTMVLFAAYLVLLNRHFRGEKVRLWLLPVLMFAWVNLHLGFGAGLALLMAYGGMEALDALFADQRKAALARLRQAAPWMAASFAATLLNPWGWGIFAALLRQQDLIKYYSDFFNEWKAVPPATFWLEALDWRNPESGYWWLLAVAFVAALAYLWRRQFGPAILLAGLATYSLLHIRFQPLLVIAAVALAEDAFFQKRPSAEQPESDSGVRVAGRKVIMGLAAAALVFVGVRVADLASNRYYLSSGQTSLFGTGLSWSFPERAAAFIEHERLPAQLFHDYNTGGYLNWRLGPAYKTFVDGRAIPFGPELFFLQRQLLSESPDSPQWLAEAERRGINTILLPTARFGGLGSFPLQSYCEAAAWQPVYLDPVAMVLVRKASVAPERIKQLAIRCATVNLLPDQVVVEMSKQGRAILYNAYMNAASIYYVLARDAEAFAAAEKAEAIFRDDSNLYLLKGQLHQVRGDARLAEQSYLESIRVRPNDASLYALTLLLAGEKRYDEAARQIARAIPISFVPYERLVTLGQIQVALEKPDEALRRFDEAQARSPYRQAASGAGVEFNARVAEGQARAWRLKGDLPRAIPLLEKATQLTPANARRWLLLATFYAAAGRGAEGKAASEKAESLRTGSGKAPPATKP